MATEMAELNLKPDNDNANNMLRMASLPIETDAEYQSGAVFLKAIKKAYAGLDEREKQITRPINESLKRMRALFENPKSILGKAEYLLKSNMLNYQRRIEAEQRRKQQEAEAAAKAERDRLAQQAAEAAQRGYHDEAQAMRQKEAQVVAAPVTPVETKVQGVSMRTAYDFEVADEAAIPREYMLVDKVKIGRVVRALGAQTSIPGIRVIERKVMAVQT